MSIDPSFSFLAVSELAFFASTHRRLFFLFLFIHPINFFFFIVLSTWQDVHTNTQIWFGTRAASATWWLIGHWGQEWGWHSALLLPVNLLCLLRPLGIGVSDAMLSGFGWGKPETRLWIRVAESGDIGSVEHRWGEVQGGWGTTKECWTLILFFSSFILDSCFDFWFCWRGMNTDAGKLQCGCSSVHVYPFPLLIRNSDFWPGVRLVVSFLFLFIQCGLKLTIFIISTKCSVTCKISHGYCKLRDKQLENW
jgi:hypothetical protein